MKCSVCLEEKDNEHFRKKSSQCKSCRNKYNKSWLAKNKQKSRASKYRNRYGIDLPEYEAILKAQNERCKICNSSEPARGKYFMVDHCHKTGIIRGLLCDACNKGLGHFKDNKELLKKAIDYLDPAA